VFNETCEKTAIEAIRENAGYQYQGGLRGPARRDSAQKGGEGPV
jgi:hypothetical protein